jgi:hypothetical protein
VLGNCKGTYVCKKTNNPSIIIIIIKDEREIPFHSTAS